jgi:replicative DNA helicase Mcm
MPADAQMVQEFEEFLAGTLQREAERLAAEYPQKKSLSVDYAALSRFNAELAAELVERPDGAIDAAREALRGMSLVLAPDVKFEPYVRFYGLDDGQRPLVKDIGAKYIGRFIEVDAIVTKVAEVRPRVQIAVWQCLHCGNLQKIPLPEHAMLMPELCECGRRDFKLDKAKSAFVDLQRSEAQEPLEKLRGGAPAHHIELWLEDDLTNVLIPGQRVEVSGIVRIRPPQRGRGPVYSRFLEVNHVRQVEKEFEELDITDDDETKIRRLAGDAKVYEKIIKSVAPSIYGHDEVKEGIALQMFGGTPNKVLSDGGKLRNDIHVLLIGDPGCLVADERIVLGNGTVTKIGSVGQYHLQQLNLQVLTGEGGAKRAHATQFHAYMSQPIIEIVTESGKSIKGTYNHPLLAVRNEHGRIVREWRRLDEFKMGDRVAVVTGFPCTKTDYVDTGFEMQSRRFGPRFKGRLPSKVTPELGCLLGYMLGDGWVQRYRAAFLVSEPEYDLLPKLLSITKKLFGIMPRVEKKKLSHGRKVQMYSAVIGSEDIASNLSFLKTKRVPELILRSGNTVLAGFLRWLYEADGSVFEKGRGSRAISLKAKDVELLRDVQLLLLRFGIHSRILGNALLIRRGEDILRFKLKVGFASNKKRKRLRQLAKAARSFKRVHRQRSERIVKILRHDTADVYDIEVPKGHRFIANGVISHNSAKTRMLQYVSTLAPKSVYVSGKSVSGVGLCVAGDALVQLNDAGIWRIGEFVEGNFKEGIEELPGAFSCRKPSRIASIAPGLKTAFGDADRIWRIKPPSHVIRLETQRGKSLRLTPQTPVIVLENSAIAWKKAGELSGSELIATTRAMPKLKGKKICVLQMLEHPHIRVSDGIAPWFAKAAAKLSEKYGDLTEAARALGIRREQLYEWKIPKYSSGAPLASLKRIALEAGMPIDSLARHVTSTFIRYGKPHRMPRFLNPALCYFAGLMAGNGDVYRRANAASIRLHGSDETFLRRIQRLVFDLFGIEARIIRSERRIPCLRFASIAVADILEKLGVPAGEKSHRIDMPPLLSSSGAKNVRAFLRGLYDTDGWVSRPANGSCCIGLTTTSRALAEKVLLALEWWGVVAKLRSRDRRWKTAFIKDKQVMSKRVQYYVEVRGFENMRRFRQAIGFGRREKQIALRRLLAKTVKPNPNLDVIPLSGLLQKIKSDNGLSERALPSQYCSGERSMSRQRLARLADAISGTPEAELLRALASSDIYWDGLKTVERERCSDEWVYDFTVNGSHAFVANGIIVHNTASAEKDELGDGGWTLKAGALVLASGGIGCIDEFDKIDETERSAMLEAMESQSYHPGTKIMFADGSEERIDDFVERLMKENSGSAVQGVGCQILPLREEHRVLTTDFNRIYGTRISRVSKHPAPSKLVKLTLQTGRQLLVTPEHPMWVMRNAEIKTISACDAKAGEYAPMPKHLPIESKGMKHVVEHCKYGWNGKEASSEDFFRFMGYYLTDGSYELGRGGVKQGINFANKNLELVDDFAGIASNLFGIKCYFRDREKTGVRTARIGLRPFADYMLSLDRMLLEKCSKRRIPLRMMGEELLKVAQMLSAIFEGDGSFSKNTVSLVSPNKEFIEQVQTLLLRFGIRSHMFQDAKVFRLTVNGTNNLALFKERINFISGRKRGLLARYLASEKSYRTATDVIPGCNGIVFNLLAALRINQNEATGYLLSGQKLKGFCFSARNFEKVVSRMENKLGGISEALRKAESATAVKELVALRNSLNLSQIDVANGNENLRHNVAYWEVRGIKLANYKRLFSQCCERKLALAAEVAKLRRLLDSDISWCEIKSVELVDSDTEWVYDVTVEPTQAFVSECAVLHNSVSVAKAGIVTRFKAKTSILAAANPKFGRFDPNMLVAQQFDIPPTLLSRFDLIFPMKDVMDEVKDRKLADHILEAHRHGRDHLQGIETKQSEDVDPVIDTELLRKYIAYARMRVHPQLTQEAMDKLKEFYVELRRIGASAGAVPITPRQIEGLIRISEASAKTRLSETVAASDAERAIALLRFVLREVLTDKETGRIDMDIINVGKPKSIADRARTMLRIVAELEKQFDLVERDRIVDEAKSYGIDEVNAKRMLEELRREGEIVEPRHGLFKTVREKVG